MRILVTGGNGFLGSHLIRRLASKGYAIGATKRKNSDTSLIKDLSENIKWFDLDLLDIPLLEETIKDFDVVVHCAAIVTMSSKNKNFIIESNARIAENIVNVALSSSLPKIIHISSIATLGKSKDGEVLNENSNWINSKTNTSYSISKYKAEQEIWRGYYEGLNVVILNPSTILGAGDWKRSSPQIVQRIDKGVLFYPSGSTGFVDVNDVVSAIIKCLENDFNGQRFVISGHNLTFQKIMNLIANKLGKPSGRIEIKPWLGGIAWRIASLVSFFSRQEPVITKKTVYSSANNYNYDNSKSKKVLGLKYTPITDTIAEMVGAYLHNK